LIEKVTKKIAINPTTVLAQRNFVACETTVSDNDNLKSHKYVRITPYQRDTKCNPNPNPNL